MDPELQNTQPNQEPRQSHILFFVGLLVVALIAGGAALYIARYVQEAPQPPSGGPADGPGTSVEATQSLYITLAGGGTREFTLYTYGLASNAFSSLLRRAYPDDFMGYTAEHNDASGETAYFWSPFNLELETYYSFERPMQLITFAEDSPNDWLQWATGPEFVKMNPNWTEDANEIVYEAFDGELTAEGLEQTDDWSIFISVRPPEGVQEAEGVATQVDTGSYPHWLAGDANILYLKADGVYIYNTASETSEIVMPLTYDVTRATQLEVSEDGTRFVLTNEADTAVVYEIASVNPFEVEQIAEITIDGSQIFWPVYAPDNSAIAFIEAEERDEFTYPDVFISIYNLANGLVERQSSIGGPFNPRIHFLTDWSE